MMMLKSSFDAALSHVVGACNRMDTGVEVRAYGCREDAAMVLRACGQKEDIEEMTSTSRLYIEVLGHKKDTAGVAGASRLDI